jgi:transposase
MHGLKVGEIHRNRFDTRVRQLLEEMPSSVSPSSHCCGCWSSLCRNGKRWTAPGRSRTQGRGVPAPNDHPRRWANHQPRFSGDRGRPGSLRFIQSRRSACWFDAKDLQSGEIARSGQISKAGDHILRHLLYEAASALMTRCRQPPKLRAWGAAIACRRGAKRARVAVARKRAVIMHRMWVSGSWFETGVEKPKMAAA